MRAIDEGRHSAAIARPLMPMSVNPVPTEPTAEMLRQMGMPSRSVPRLLALLLAVQWSLTACDSFPEASVRSGPSASPDTSSTTPDDDETPSARARRAGGGTGSPSGALLASFTVELMGGGQSRLVLTTHGSSSCPWIVKDVVATGKHIVTITVGSREGTKERPCTADDAKRRETVSLPAEVQAQKVTTARLITADGASHTASVVTRD